MLCVNDESKTSGLIMSYMVFAVIFLKSISAVQK